MPPIDLKAFAQRRNTIKNRFRAARSLKEMLRIFAEAEEVFTDDELGEAFLNISMNHYHESIDNEKTLSFAQRGLKAFTGRDDNVENAVPIAILTQIVGLTCLRLERYDESLYYLNAAVKLLNKLRGDRSVTGSSHVLNVLHDAEFGLFSLKKAVGMREEAIVHLTNAMALGEIIRKDRPKPLYSGYRQIATENIGIMNYGEALYHCLKGLELLMLDPGHNPSELRDCRRCLARIFHKLNGDEMTLTVSARLQVEAAFEQIELGCYDDAIDNLTAIIPSGGEESEQRATVIASMSKTLTSFGKTFWEKGMFRAAKDCLESSLRIISKQERYHSPHLLVTSLIETSEVLEEMKTTDTSILGSYNEAIKLLEKIVATLKGDGPSAQESLDKAILFLSQLKAKESEESS